MNSLPTWDGISKRIELGSVHILFNQIRGGSKPNDYVLWGGGVSKKLTNYVDMEESQNICWFFVLKVKLT